MLKKTASGRTAELPCSGRLMLVIRRYWLRPFLYLLVGFSVTMPASVLASQQCIVIAERQLIDAILNQDQAVFEKRLQLFEEENAIIPSKDYYEAMNTWHQGYQEKNALIKKSGIKALFKAISNLERRLNESPPYQRNIALGLTKGHTARILLENDQFIAGYNLGIEAKDHIEQIFDSLSEATPGFNDAGFLLGLYEIYTSELTDKDHWLIRRIADRGNRRRGLALVEKAISENSIFATEALRALLGEVQWRMPEFCHYLDRIDDAGQRYPGNADLSILRQGLLLKCGHVDRAREANQFYTSQKDLPDAMLEQIKKAWLRISADLGDVTALEQNKVFGDENPYQQLAHANALDVSNRRQEAIKIYRHLLESSNSPQQVQSVARVRLKYPYSAPRRITMPQKSMLHPGTC